MQHKKPKVIEFGRYSHVTNAALAKVLRDVRELGIPDAVSEGTRRRQRAEICAQRTSFGPLVSEMSVRTESGGDIHVPVQHPLAFLEVATRRSTEFRKLMANTLARSGNMIRIILYTDDVTPGQQLNSKNFRKTCAIYWSIADFPVAVLSCEDAWFTMSCVRVVELEEIDGGLSHVLKLLLHKFFAPPYDLRQGVSIDLSLDSPVLVFGEVYCMIQDLLAHDQSTLCKGHSGHKPCPLCRNVVSLSCPWLPDATGRLLHIGSLEVEKFMIHTDATISALLKNLRDIAHGVLEGDLGDLQTQMGFNHSDNNLFLCSQLSLGLTSIVMFDWMHILFIGGIFAVEMLELSKRLATHNMGSAQMGAYFSQFRWPHGYASGASVCSDGKFGGSASEMLSVAPVIAKYLRDVVQPAGFCDKEVVSGILLCDLVDLLSVVNGGGVTPAKLEEAILQFLHAHIRADELKLWIPKHHYLIHLPMQLFKFGFLLNTFVQERKHRVLKRMCTPRHNTSSFDKGVLQDMTCQHLFDLEEPLLRESLRDPVPAPARMVNAIKDALVCTADVFTSKSFVVNHRTVCKGDLALLADGQVAEIWFHVRVAGFCWACVSKWGLISNTDRGGKFRRANSPSFIPGSLIEQSVIYSACAENEVSHVLYPAGHRK